MKRLPCDYAVFKPGVGQADAAFVKALEKESNGHTKITPHQDGWQVILEYEKQGVGPYLVDLSHRMKWDIQDSKIDSIKPWGVSLPGKPGESLVAENGILVSRLNHTQVFAIHLGTGNVHSPGDQCVTDVTDGFLCLALMGETLFEIMERANSPDLKSRLGQTLSLFQAPIFQLPARLILFESTRSMPCLLLACSRGYGHAISKAFSQVGGPLKLRPAGESVFNSWFQSEYK